MGNTILINKTDIKVRFNEVDSMKVVWHGHYLQYFEDGREAFGKQYGISYMDFFSNNIYVPLVKIEMDFKRSLKWGEHALVETRYVDSAAAKLVFAYTIYNKDTNEVITTGKSVQAFIDLNRELMLTIPKFFSDWREKWINK